MGFNVEEYTEKYVIGFGKLSGIRVIAMEEGLAVGDMPVGDQDHSNPLGTVHGGAVFTLADTIGGIAARTMGAYPTTCSSTISYLRPTIGCKKLIATAKVIKNGSNTIVADIAITDDKDRHVSQVLATYFNLPSDVFQSEGTKVTKM